MISEAVHDIRSAEHVGRDSSERRLVHVIDRLLFELEECNLIGLSQPSPDLRIRCLTALATVSGKRETKGARTDDAVSLMDRLFAAQHELMRRQRSPEFHNLINDHD